MVHMMRYDIDLFGNDLQREIARDEQPEFIAERVGAVCAIAMMPDGAVRAHEHHAVEEGGHQQAPGKIVKDEDEEKGRQADYLQPAHKGKPVLARSENIESIKKLPQNLPV